MSILQINQNKRGTEACAPLGVAAVSNKHFAAAGGELHPFLVAWIQAGTEGLKGCGC